MVVSKERSAGEKRGPRSVWTLACVFMFLPACETMTSSTVEAVCPSSRYGLAEVGCALSITSGAAVLGGITTTTGAGPSSNDIQEARGRSAAEAERRAQRVNAVRSYLKFHGEHVKRDVHLGAGPTVADLAKLLGIRERVSCFGGALRKHRDSVAKMVDARDGEALVNFSENEFAAACEAGGAP